MAAEKPVGSNRRSVQHLAISEDVEYINTPAFQQPAPQASSVANRHGSVVSVGSGGGAEGLASSMRRLSTCSAYLQADGTADDSDDESFRVPSNRRRLSSVDDNFLPRPQETDSEGRVLPRGRKQRRGRFNSTSTLYVVSTMSKPDKYLAIKGVAYMIQSNIEDNSRSLSIFDEPSLDPRLNPAASAIPVKQKRSSQVSGLTSALESKRSSLPDGKHPLQINTEALSRAARQDDNPDDSPWSDSPSPLSRSRYLTLDYGHLDADDDAFDEQRDAAYSTVSRNTEANSLPAGSPTATTGLTPGPPRRHRSSTASSMGVPITSNAPAAIPHTKVGVFVPALRVPSALRIYKFIRKIFDDCQLEIDCIINSVVYVERLVRAQTFVLTPRNWRPVVLTSLLLASKVWDDLSMWNVDFSTVFAEFPLAVINHYERNFLVRISYDVIIPASEYAQYYFALRDREKNAGEPQRPEVPLDVLKSMRLEVLARPNFAKEAMRRRALTGGDEESPRARAVIN